jgi:hypothetical protein
MQRPFPDDPQHWRLRAEEARVCAEFISDPQSKSTMMEIADRYEQIAARAEERIGETEKRPSAPYYSAKILPVENDGFECCAATTPKRINGRVAPQGPGSDPSPGRQTKAGAGRVTQVHEHEDPFRAPRCQSAWLRGVPSQAPGTGSAARCGAAHSGVSPTVIPIFCSFGLIAAKTSRKRSDGNVSSIAT